MLRQFCNPILDRESDIIIKSSAYKSEFNLVPFGRMKNLVKALFMSVYRRLAVNSIQKHVKKRRCPKTFWPGSPDSLANFPRPGVEAPAAWKLKSCTFMCDQSVRLVTVARSRKSRS